MKRTEAAHQECSYCEHKVMFEPGMPTLADWHSIRRIDSVSFSRFIEPGERDQHVSGWFERIKAFARNMAAGKVVAHETGAACCGKWYSATAYDYACNQRDEARAEVEKLKVHIDAMSSLSSGPFYGWGSKDSKIATLAEEAKRQKNRADVYCERNERLEREISALEDTINAIHRVVTKGATA